MKQLGIDVGTGGTRAVVVDENGSVVASATADHAPFASPQTGWAEQEPHDWWRATTEAVRGVLSVGEVSVDEIACVGFSGQMHGAVLLDEGEEVLRPALIWCDQRTDAQGKAITKLVGASRLIELTANPALTNFTLTKLMWVRENEPELWSRFKFFLLPKDYVRLRLTGVRATDVADASGTLLLDVANRCWSDAVLSAVSINKSCLPALFESSEITGRVSANGAAATGLLEGTPVVAGAGDQAAGAVGMGIVRPGAVSATIGTSGVVFAATARPALDKGGRVHTFCHAIPGRWHVMGVTQAAGRARVCDSPPAPPALPVLPGRGVESARPSSKVPIRHRPIRVARWLPPCTKGHTDRPRNSKPRHLLRRRTDHGTSCQAQAARDKLCFVGRE